MKIVRNSADSGINGQPGALDVDRSIIELRYGRAIAVIGEKRTLVVAALETASETLLDQLLSLPGEAVLLVTPERAQSASLNGGGVGPVAVSIRGTGDLAALRAYGGLTGLSRDFDPALSVATWSGSEALAAAGFRLAKAGRLIPALVAVELDRFEDPSVTSVALAAIAERSDLARRGLVRISDSRLPLSAAENTSITLFRDEHSGSEHVAVVIGDPVSAGSVPLRLHSACLTGDVFGSLRCDCGEQLEKAVIRIAELGAGVLLYLDQEGRGIGLANKLRAYSIQDLGLDTLDADRHLGFSEDERTYDVAAAMLRELGILSVRVMTNNPLKIAALREHGIEVAGRVPLVGSTNTHNEGYLRAKRERAGHLAEHTGSKAS